MLQQLFGRLTALALTLVLSCSAAAAAPNDVLVAVQPAEESLTRATHERLMEFIEWVFKAPLTEQQRARLSGLVLEEWADAKERAGLREWLAAADQVDTLSAAQRSLAREQLLEAVVPALRAEAKKDKDAKWFLGIYESANRPLVKGTPPLTRQASDAMLEMLYFVVGKGHGVEVAPTQTDFDSMAKELSAAWPKLSPERRQEIAAAPMQWATLRAAWDVASEKDRAAVARDWKAAYPMQTTGGASGLMQEVEAKLRELDALISDARQPLSRERLLREADAIAALAARAQREPGSEARALAQKLAVVEKSLRGATPAPSNPQPGTARTESRAQPTGAAAIASQTQSLMFMQQMHQQRMAMMEQSRMAHFNMIQNLGNSSYRYVNSFGNPY